MEEGVLRKKLIIFFINNFTIIIYLSTSLYALIIHKTFVTTLLHQVG